MLENQLITDDVQSSFMSDSGVDLFGDLFADSTEFAFCWINESACGLS